MIRNSLKAPSLRSALAGAALASVLFLAVVGGLHVHEGHAAGECDLCLHLDHLGLEIVEVTAPQPFHCTTGHVALPVVEADAGPIPDADPARGPPFLS